MKKNQNGFTLIEVLIAITILSVMMLSFISITDSTFNTADTVTKEDQEILQLETAMSRLEWDISQLYSPLYFSHPMRPDGLAENEGEIYNRLIDSYQRNNRFSLLSYDGIPIPLYKKPEKTTLVFFTSSNRRKMENVNQSRYNWIRYSLEPNDAENEEEKTASSEKTLMLIRQVLNYDIYNPEPIQWEDIKKQVLFRKIISLKIEFWNPETEKWTENIELVKNGVHLIHALRVEIVYLDPDDIELTTVRIFRPLFPEFKPEDMYKFLNAKPTNQKNNNTNNRSRNSGDNTGEESETE